MAAPVTKVLCYDRTMCSRKLSNSFYCSSLENQLHISGSPAYTKKKELVGRFRNAGVSWEPAPVPVNDHDFRSHASGLAVPHGIYDTLANRGFVSVGVSSDTAFFAVDNLDAWWRSEGSSRYPDASQLILLADCGGSNSYRIRAWKYALQHRFCNVHQLPVTVAHYPAGCSKWNAPLPLQRDQPQLVGLPAGVLRSDPQLHRLHYHPHRIGGDVPAQQE